MFAIFYCSKLHLSPTYLPIVTDRKALVNDANMFILLSEFIIIITMDETNLIELVCDLGLTKVDSENINKTLTGNIAKEKLFKYHLQYLSMGQMKRIVQKLVLNESRSTKH